MKDNLIRCTIPFKYTNYDELKENNYALLSQNDWEKKNILPAESDLYESIHNLLTDNKENSVGTTWKRKLEKNNLGFETKLEDNNVFWNMNDVGLVLFNEGIGIIWYEIDIKNKNISEEVLQNFCKFIKELSHKNINKKYTGKCHECVIEITSDMLKLKEEITNHEDYIETSNSEYCVKKADLPDECKNDDYKIIDILYIKEKNKQKIIVKGAKETFFYKESILPFFKDINIETFFANRKKGDTYLPDKTINFVHVLCDTQDNDKISVRAFKLAKNFNKSYHINDEIDKERFYKTSDELTWFVCREGCANVVMSEESFFTNGDYKRRLDIYFYLYLLCLGQHFILLSYFDEVGIQVNQEKFNLKAQYKAEKLLERINFFRLKNIYTQVSHLTEHNDYYAYLKIKLKIEEMHDELTCKTQYIYEIIKQKNEEKKERVVRLISCCSGVFALFEIFSSIMQTFEKITWKKSLVGVLILVFFAGVIYFLWEKVNKIRK